MTRENGGGLVGLISGGFLMPLVGFFVLIGVLYGLSQHEFAQSGIRPRDPGDIARAGDPDRPVKNGGRRAPGLTSEQIRVAITEGRFDEALKAARRAGSGDLTDEALLFTALTGSIKTNAVGRGESLVAVTTTSGDRIVGVLASDGDAVVIQQPDGFERSVPLSKIKARDALSGDAAKAAVREHFETARAAMGEEVNGLALHRLSFLAFAADERPLGAKLLREALVGTEGGILVDMFGEGDFDRLHRIRRRLAGLPEEVQVAMAAPEPEDVGETMTRDPDPGPDPEPYVEPEPYDPEPDPEPEPNPVEPNEPDPEPLTSDRRAERRAEYNPQTDPALNDPRWRRAGGFYRDGLDLYRGSFGVASRIGDAAIRAAHKEFSKAQRELDSLMNTHREHLIVERRAQEINQLIIDCMKRQRVDLHR